MFTGTFTGEYLSPIGTITFSSDGERITGLWFNGQKYFNHGLISRSKKEDLPVFSRLRDWLDIYFSGIEPDFMPPTVAYGSSFQESVWKILRQIPYGETVTYGQIAKILAENSGKNVSAQAVGSAVGRNPISILIPCHRVMGANRSLTGYAGGIDKKAYLLRLEGIETL